MERSLILFACLFLVVCGCFDGSDRNGSGVRADAGRAPDAGTSAGPSEQTSGTAAGERPSHGDNVLSRVFSLKNKIAEVRYLYEHGREEYAVRQAENILPRVPPNTVQRLELHFLMARCYERLGQSAARKRHDREFRLLLERLGKSRQHQEAMKEAADVREVVDRSIEMAVKIRDDRRVPDDEDEMLNVRCARRLSRVSDEQVLHEDLEPSGDIYYGRTAEAVRKQAAAALGLPEDEVVLQRDPRFGFYFVLVEGKP